MKCTNCGEEIEDGMKFCGLCGAPAPQNKKCPSCGAEIPLRMKFCPECGTPQDGSRPTAAASLAMGDRNVIAGDVTGKKEETHIAGNATIIKNEDQTKQVRKCHVCGKMVQITQGFECPECGEFTCENCYDSDSGLCKSCAVKKTSGKAEQYRSAVREALADGRIDFADRRKLDTLQRELGMNRDEALAIEAEEKAGGVSAKSVGSGLSTVEQVELETIAEQFYRSDYSDCVDNALVERIEKLYSAHRTDEKVLALYLPVLAATKGGAEKALGIIKSLPVDVLGVYIAAADIMLEQGDLAQAENYVNNAKAIGQNDPLVLCREAYLNLAMYKQYGSQNFLASAESIAQTVSAVQTQDKILKSHQVRLAMLVEQAKGNDVPEMDEDFCNQNGLYYRIISIVPTKIVDNIEALQTALAEANGREKLIVLPGIYGINFPVNKSVILEANEGETILEFSGELSVTASAVFKGITFVGKDKPNTLAITGSATPQFKNCSFENCGLDISGRAYPLIENCKIKKAVIGICVKDAAGVKCTGCSIEDVRRPKALDDNEFADVDWVSDSAGIKIFLDGQEPVKQSLFKDVKVTTGRDEVSSDGVQIKGLYAKPQFLNCESYDNGSCGFEVSENAAPVLEQCKAYKNDMAGFMFWNGSYGTCRNCEAYDNTGDEYDYGFGFLIVDGSDPVFEQCKAYNNKGCGFENDGPEWDPGKGTFRNCKAYNNGDDTIPQ